MQTLILWARSSNARIGQRHDRVGERAELAGDAVIAAQLDLDRLAGGAFESQLGLMDRDGKARSCASRTWKATNSFRAAWSVIWRVAASQRWLAAR